MKLKFSENDQLSDKIIHVIKHWNFMI